MVKRNVWVVEQGSYSDYRVVGVFSTQESAKLIADAINSDERYDEATVAAWPLDPAVRELRAGFKHYFVQMQEDGTVDRCEIWTIGSDLAGSERMWRRSKAPAYAGKGVADVLHVNVWAKDETHAIKIANEHRTRMIASGEWANDPVTP